MVAPVVVSYILPTILTNLGVVCSYSTYCGTSASASPAVGVADAAPHDPYVFWADGFISHWPWSCYRTGHRHWSNKLYHVEEFRIRFL